jgi:hypothetical protein
MKCVEATEYLSDYQEGILAPEVRLNLDRHLESCAGCRAELAALSSVFELLATDIPEVDVPSGFRASILAKIAEQEQQHTHLSLWERIFGRSPWAIAATLASAAAILVVGVLLLRQPAQAPLGPQTTSAGMVSGASWSGHVPVHNQDCVLQNVVLGNSGGHTYHVFGLHLPDGVPKANLSAYVLQDSKPLVDETALTDTDDAQQVYGVTAQAGISYQVPIAVEGSSPAGSTLAFLVRWSAVGQPTPESRELAFAPIAAAEANPTPLSAGTTLYDALQAIASRYQVTVIADDNALNRISQPMQGALDGSQLTPDGAFSALVAPDGFKFTHNADGSYIVHGPL